MKQNSMLAMILAGGRGSRLHDLTNKVAKPAVSYGGKYRIVDFPLSNCANSGVDVVGVLTQYESIQLNSYVAAGGRWGLDAKNSGVYVLPPREKADENLNVYRGTADAISQNIDFIDKFDPEYVLVLSGDHIYKMNYDKMLAAHKEAKAVLEGLFYAFLICVMGLPLSLIVANTILPTFFNQPDLWLFTIQPTIFPLILEGIVICVVAIIVPHVSFRYFRKTSIVARLRVVE